MDIITDLGFTKNTTLTNLKKKIQLIKKTQMSYCSSMASLLSPSPIVLLQHKVIWLFFTIWKSLKNQILIKIYDFVDFFF